MRTLSKIAAVAAIALTTFTVACKKNENITKLPKHSTAKTVNVGGWKITGKQGDAHWDYWVDCMHCPFESNFYCVSGVNVCLTKVSRLSTYNINSATDIDHMKILPFNETAPGDIDGFLYVSENGDYTFIYKVDANNSALFADLNNIQMGKTPISWDGTDKPTEVLNGATRRGIVYDTEYGRIVTITVPSDDIRDVIVP